jgi:predicted ATPase
MNDALVANQPNIALQYLTLGAQRRYAVTFHAIAQYSQVLVDSYRTTYRGELNGSYLEYIVAREMNGEANQLFYIYAMKNSDGTWRLDTM